MSRNTISTEVETKRIRDFEEIAKSWDSIPEYAQGLLDGTIRVIAAICRDETGEKKAG